MMTTMMTMTMMVMIRMMMMMMMVMVMVMMVVLMTVMMMVMMVIMTGVVAVVRTMSVPTTSEYHAAWLLCCYSTMTAVDVAAYAISESNRCFSTLPLVFILTVLVVADLGDAMMIASIWHACNISMHVRHCDEHEWHGFCSC